MKSMTIIGSGKLGKTIGRLLREKAGVRIEQVMNRSQISSLEAIKFIGEGVPSNNNSDLIPVDAVFLGTDDDSMCAAIDTIRMSSVIRKGTVVFHCSGSQPSSILEPLRNQGAVIASVHPIKSFSDPLTSFETFEGTYCGWEGDAEAMEFILPLFEKCGAILFKIEADHKLIYHAGTVFISNYLTALLEVGLRCFEKSGINRESGMAMMKPIIEGTIINNYKFGTAHALTGPVARGDADLVENELQALQQWDNQIAKVYSSLGLIAAQLSKLQGNASEEELIKINTALNRSIDT